MWRTYTREIDVLIVLEHNAVSYLADTNDPKFNM